MPFDAKTMPPAKVSGSPIPHEGSINSEDAAFLKKQGYDVVDVRSTTGPRQIELLFQAFLLGTVEYDSKRMSAAEQIRLYWGKTSKDDAEKALTEVKEAPDAMALLANLGVKEQAGIPLPPHKKRGRPKGSKTKARNE